MFIIVWFSPKLASYELLLALRCLVNTGPDSQGKLESHVMKCGITMRHMHNDLDK